MIGALVTGLVVGGIVGAGVMLALIYWAVAHVAARALGW